MISQYFPGMSTKKKSVLPNQRQSKMLSECIYGSVGILSFCSSFFDSQWIEGKNGICKYFIFFKIQRDQSNSKQGLKNFNWTGYRPRPTQIFNFIQDFLDQHGPKESTKYASVWHFSKFIGTQKIQDNLKVFERFKRISQPLQPFGFIRNLLDHHGSKEKAKCESVLYLSKFLEIKKIADNVKNLALPKYMPKLPQMLNFIQELLGHYGYRGSAEYASIWYFSKFMETRKIQGNAKHLRWFGYHNIKGTFTHSRPPVNWVDLIYRGTREISMNKGISYGMKFRKPIGQLMACRCNLFSMDALRRYCNILSPFFERSL